MDSSSELPHSFEINFIFKKIQLFFFFCLIVIAGCLFVIRYRAGVPDILGHIILGGGRGVSCLAASLACTK